MEVLELGVKVAEYLGQRTDIDTPTILPGNRGDLCPYMHNTTCDKLNRNNEPVCSVRRADGTLWITCASRLCATKKNIPLCTHQVSILHEIGKSIYDPEIQLSSICVKREERLTVVEGTNYNADYILTLEDGMSPYPGPDRMVLEMQGGGETTNTGSLTRQIIAWRNNQNRTNEILRQEVRSVSTLETNAWRRQQEQFIVKGNIAMKTWKGYGIAFCVGSLLFDYLMNKLTAANLPDLRQYNWTLALIGISENAEIPPTPGPIPLKVDTQRQLFTNYQTFVQALINQGEPSLAAFAGDFLSLSGNAINISRHGR